MALASQGFVVNKLTISQILAELPKENGLLKENYFKDQLYGHVLGIGWNKIEFHRDFCRYAGLIETAKISGEFKLSPLGEIIRRHDPNLSDLATWWFIHTNLVLDKETNVYSALFCNLSHRTLSKEEIAVEINSLLGSNVSTAVLKKDVDAILRWFADSPLGSLGTFVTDGKNWKRRKPSRTPDPYVIAYAALELHRRNKRHSTSSKISELIKGANSLYCVFHIDEGDLKAGLRQAQSLLSSEFLAVSDTAGLDTVYFGNKQSSDIAEKYYTSRKQFESSAS